MPATLTIRDEALGSQDLHESALEVLTERITVRELIRSRVYQEVQDYNLKQGDVFQGLVQPTDAEKSLNGWTMKKPRLLDWKAQFEKAVEAFENNQILILVNDVQAESLEQGIAVEPGAAVTFLKLKMLVGG